MLAALLRGPGWSCSVELDCTPGVPDPIPIELTMRAQHATRGGSEALLRNLVRDGRGP